MKRIGIISYSNNSGLGVITANFRKHLPLNSQFIIKHPIKDAPGEIYDIGIPHTFGDLEPTEEQLNEYLDTCKPEVVIVVETPFNFDFFKIMYDRGVKVILIPMIDSISVEKFIPYEKYIDLVINFTKVGQEIYEKQWPGGGINGINIPYPIDTDIFNPDERKTPFKTKFDVLVTTDGEIDDDPKVLKYLHETVPTFTHSEGWGGCGHRKGTDLVCTAYQQLYHKNKECSLMLRGQPGEDQHSVLSKLIINGKMFVSRYDIPDEYVVDLYKTQIYLAPSRREGLGLPILEAMACGLPVITTNAPPMNEWFPEDYPLLVKVQCQTDLPYGDIPMYTPSAFDLMQKMEFAYKNPELMEQVGEINRIIIQEKYSWRILRDTYLEFLDR